MRKLVDATYRSSSSNVWRPKNWVYFRMAEIYLNCAEALNEVGQTGDACQYINAIRDRAGLPYLPAGLSQSEMQAKIHHERRIELAFETHRFFDVRRWQKAVGTQDQAVYGMNILYGNNATDPAFYARTLVESRVFERQHYLFPIPQDEINNNLKNLVQNPDW
jgi:hypothetical protein